MLDSFIAFNINGISNFIYMITSNLWFLLLLVRSSRDNRVAVERRSRYSST